MLDLRYKMLDEPAREPRQTELGYGDTRPGATLYVALRAGEVVGTAVLTRSQKEGLYLIDQVATRYHRQGIGRAVMQHLEVEARDLGATQLGLDAIGTDEALRFYDAIGYSPRVGGGNLRGWRTKDL